MNFNIIFTYFIDEPTRKSLRNVTRWFNTIVHQPQVAKVLGGKLIQKKNKYLAHYY